MTVTQEQTIDDPEVDKYMIAFDRLVGLIGNKGKITSQDIENDSILKEALSEQTGIEAIRFLFQKTNDHIMAETKKLVNDPRKKVQEIADTALKIAEKMINCGELWSNVQQLILESDVMRGLRQLGLA
ncbi:MAG: hypothetical protein A3I68_05125 [Candidatus Melainabacteria bacterium RIFCSPLOWO2_02_FULL_35_15]|nr:MAG: hypothetical protein A3F80_07435 [Candidatus Melainabacteria bacterium RIFCSPLOWO2_12_FULL_35_11]OGI12834.1 MAG: hypothetical protein A3I68_05125 [Candidatus Melainabacteria bacterium RIFCSPLOWO2_02_FULL_35_15]